MRRKTRFVCVSDTHGYTPSEAGFKLPAGDVLIHAGDLTNNGSMSELRRTMDWISKADFEIKILVAGNHDVSLDPEFYAKHGHTFHGQKLEDPQQCIDIVTGAAPSVIFLQHQAVTIRLTRENGPRTAFTVSKGHGPLDMSPARLWHSGTRSPPNVDIVVTHTPPQHLCDRKPDGSFVGCNSLRQTLSRIRPPLAICGHVHEGRGYRRVRWRDASMEDTQHNEATETGEGADRFIDVPLPPRGSKKLNLVDLTGKRGDRLDSYGFACEVPGLQPLSETTNMRVIPLLDSTGSAAVAVPDEQRKRANESFSISSSSSTGDRSLECLSSPRKETCILNAAIVATSWPHLGGKQFNAPIVVDIELPEWWPLSDRENDLGEN
ncbi:hypothetical protein N7533_002773 [Penicillium manginii]|uniref:uncharacterized protein n=1 Tax=Penicillium manginii TaxID=203109 RepID=UPI002549A935|nr:uncharacterized protein N7533_002773 [Penicillium manginii]KAJ5764092.1 hypothetical protein N7533_002773 [Penicillium manginii]